MDSNHPSQTDTIISLVSVLLQLAVLIHTIRDRRLFLGLINLAMLILAARRVPAETRRDIAARLKVRAPGQRDDGARFQVEPGSPDAG